MCCVGIVQAAFIADNRQQNTPGALSPGHLRFATLAERIFLMKHLRSLAAVVLGVILGITATHANRPPAPPTSAQAVIGTAFTYQGRLSDGGATANGAYDFRFRLYDAAADGLQIGPTVTQTGVLVSHGLFTATLDFGAVFDGTALYLEIAVSPAGGGNYTPLSPRQALTPAPYANYARQAGTLTLPFAGGANRPETLFILANTGSGQAADLDSASSFATLSVSNNGAGGAIWATTDDTGQGSAVTAYNDGTDRYAGEFEITKTTNPRAAIYARTAGTGQAIDAEVNSATTADALFARTTSPTAGSYAGVFSGPVQISCSAATCNTTNALQVVGNFSASVKNFKIDHPLEPATKYLNHTSVESPDMKNIYDGVITTDASGLATVALPAYFQALNKDFRYQLTVMGTFAQAIVKDEIANNRFTIQTDKPNVKVSWQVTGIRQDAYARAYPIPVEEEKPASERGRYLAPELFGQPPAQAIGADTLPEPQPQRPGR
jgi:hypothetical protein